MRRNNCSGKKEAAQRGLGCDSLKQLSIRCCQNHFIRKTFVAVSHSLGKTIISDWNAKIIYTIYIMGLVDDVKNWFLKI